MKRIWKLSNCVDKEVKVMFIDDDQTYEELGKLKREDIPSKNFGFYINDKHVPIKGLSISNPPYFEVNLNYNPDYKWH